MPETKKDLAQLVSIIKYCANVEANEIMGIQDTNSKIWACYMAAKVTDCTNREIAGYFSINVHYMIKMIQAFAIEFLLDPSLSVEMDKLCDFYNELKMNES